MDLKKAREILEIENNYSKVEIKRRYKELAKKYHPDLNNSKEAHDLMLEINKAYETVMKKEFDIIDPWKDYQKWWQKQFGNDPLWGNPTAEEYYGNSKKYPGIAKENRYIESSRKDPKKDIIKEFLDKKNTFAVIGVSKDPKKYGNKAYKDLKSAGYEVYPINPRVDKIDDEECYGSLEDLPRIPDVINLVVPPEITEKVVKKAIKLGVKRIWMQPGSESKEIIDYCKENGVTVLHDMCIMVEQNRFNNNGKNE